MLEHRPLMDYDRNLTRTKAMASMKLVILDLYNYTYYKNGSIFINSA